MMKRILFLGVLLVALISNAQTTIYTQDFEVNMDGYSNVPNQIPASDPGDQYFSIANPTDLNIYESSGQLYTNVTNTSLFVGSNPNTINSGNPGVLSFDPISVTGFSNLEFRADFGAVPNDWDNSDNLEVQYNFDGGSWVTLVQFGNNNGTNDPLTVITNGTGGTNTALGTVLTFNLQTIISNNFTGSGNILNIRILVESNANYEAFALDNVVVTGFGSGANLSPSISNIQRIPAISLIALNTNVDVTTDITDPDGDLISSASLDWSFTNLSSVNTTGAVVMTESTTIPGEWIGQIPGQTEDGDMSFTITATDDNASPAMSTSSPIVYTIQAPQAEGLQIDTEDVIYAIDFDNTVPNINEGTFDASGLAEIPTTGQLDSNAFAFDGFSDGDTAFNENNTSGDYARGTSTGGVSTGGIYAFEVSTGNTALGIQPTSSEFTPGTIYLRINNQTGTDISELSVAYDAYLFNNENRSNNLILAHGVNQNSLVTVVETTIETGLLSDASPEWQRNFVTATLTGFSILDGETYVLAWQSTDSGSNFSDEFALDNLQIIANPSTEKVRLSGDVNSITLAGNVIIDGATRLNESLNMFSDELITNNQLTFASSDGNAAYIAPFVNGSITGDVIVEQFYPAQRAFRFMSSPVTMTGTIFDNIQQGGLNPGDTGYVAGVGTHITGGTAMDGFDQSTSNAPSSFIFDHSTQNWEGISSANGFDTNSDGYAAGESLRLFIRGDRSVSLTAAGAIPNDAMLSFTGTLAVGEVTLGNLAANEGEFNFIGNPYQAQVNISSLLNDVSTVDISDSNFYAWDPTIGTNGAYVVYSFTTNTSNMTGSEVNEILQPGQAIFLTTSEDGDDAASLAPAMIFKESFKNSDSNTTAVYRNSTVNELISVSLFKDNEMTSGKARDGILISFNANGSNLIDSKDALKLTNPDENFSMTTNGQSLSVTERAIPIDGEVLPLKINGLTGFNYTLELNNNFTGLESIFVDYYLGTETVMNAGVNMINVSFDNNIAASIDEDRFALKFVNDTLSVGDSAFAKMVTIYPNPVSNGILYFNNPTAQELNVKMFNMQGQQIISINNLYNNQLNVSSLNRGTYLLSIHNETESSIQKIVIE